MAEGNVCAYWEHWYKLSQSGHGFVFKKTSIPKKEVDSNPSVDEEVQPEVEENEFEERSKPEEKEKSKDQDWIQQTPDQSHSDEERISFLQALIPDQTYQAIVEILINEGECLLLFTHVQ